MRHSYIRATLHVTWTLVDLIIVVVVVLFEGVVRFFLPAPMARNITQKWPPASTPAVECPQAVDTTGTMVSRAPPFEALKQTDVNEEHFAAVSEWCFKGDLPICI